MQLQIKMGIIQNQRDWEESMWGEIDWMGRNWNPRIWDFWSRSEENLFWDYTLYSGLAWNELRPAEKEHGVFILKFGGNLLHRLVVLNFSNVSAIWAIDPCHLMSIAIHYWLVLFFFFKKNKKKYYWLLSLLILCTLNTSKWLKDCTRYTYAVLKGKFSLTELYASNQIYTSYIYIWTFTVYSFFNNVLDHMCTF